MINESRKTLGSILGIIMFIICVLIISYAFYSWKSDNTNIDMLFSDKTVLFTMGNNINATGLAPILDYTAEANYGEENNGKYLAYTEFIVSNTSSESNYYSAKLYISRIDEELKDETFKYVLLKKSSTSSGYDTQVCEGNFSNFIASEENTICDGIEVSANIEDNYRFVVYIDGNEKSDINMMDRSLESTLIVKIDENSVVNISLDNQGAIIGSTGTSKIYQRTGTGIYKDSTASTTEMTNSANPITIPVKENNPFLGYYTGTNCTGVKLINDTGYITSDFTNDKFATDTTLYACYQTYNYNVTYNYSDNGGTSATKTSANINYGESIDLTPTATKNGWTFIGWNTNKDALEGLNTLNMGDSNVILYAIYKKSLTATFYYYNSGIKNTSASCDMYNASTSCNVTVPLSIFNETTAQYGGIYVGYGDVNTVGTNTNSTASITQDTNYYVSYRKTVTENYQGTTRSIYRNEYFVSSSAMNTVLSTSDTGTSNFEISSYNKDSITWSWYGYATSSSSSSRAYSSVANAATSTTTTLFTLYSRSIIATFYYYNGSAQATTTASGTQLANYQASVVSNGSISIPSTVSSSTGPNNVSYSGLSTSTSSTTTTTTINTSQTKYYAIYVADYTASFAKENSNVSSIGSTSLSCSSKATTNGTTYSSTACSITLPSITPATGYIALGWYNSSDTLVGQAGDNITITSNQSYTAKARRLTASEFSYDNTDTGVDCNDVQCMIDKLDIPMADQFSYDNSETGVDCSDIQCMIDKLDENAGG